MGDPFFRSASMSKTSSKAVEFDEGLRAHMVRVFNYMGGGLAITGLIAFLVANVPFLAQLVYGTPLKWVAMFAPLVFIMVLNFKFEKMSAGGIKKLFWAFCAVMGISMAAIFMVYTNASIARVFFITASTFSAMALWGYTTKKDLSSMGSFLMMGVFGIFIAMIVNIFLGSNMLQWIVSILGVAIFTGLTAYDTQNIKRSYSENWGQEANNKLAVMGALKLYLNFINAFYFLMNLMGDQR